MGNLILALLLEKMLHFLSVSAVCSFIYIFIEKAIKSE